MHVYTHMYIYIYIYIYTYRDRPEILQPIMLRRPTLKPYFQFSSVQFVADRPERGGRERGRALTYSCYCYYCASCTVNIINIIDTFSSVQFREPRASRRIDPL